MLDEMSMDNSAHHKRQKALDIRATTGSPPYFAGQESANDSNANIEYPHLDVRTHRVYTERPTAILKNTLYNSCIRAIYWASDRIEQQSVIGFVTNVGWVEANITGGSRKRLAEESPSLYAFHLRGNQCASGERFRKEGDKIFDSGSRMPIAIFIPVKNPQAEERGQICFHDIGDYLTHEQKLEIIIELGSTGGIIEQQGWQGIVPDGLDDWLGQRDPNSDSYISLGNRKSRDEIAVFENYSRGTTTSRDVWCYNLSGGLLRQNMQNMIGSYSNEVARFQAACRGLPGDQRPDVNNSLNYDDTKMSQGFA